MRTHPLILAAALMAAGALTACSGGDGGTSTPTGPSTPPASSDTTITISSAGVSPKTITVPIGSRVTFVNNDSRAHDMSSDPHPEHSQCPDITVGNVQPGQSRTTSNLNTARTCGYHDHNQAENTSLQGTIRIQ